MTETSNRKLWSALLAVVAAAVLALLAALTTAPTASAALPGGPGATFAVRCDFSHFNKDDPIFYPGQRGVAHRHDFFGNTSTKFDSTYTSMLASTTTCSRPEDTAGYWLPTVKWNGTNLLPFRGVFYYRAGGKNHTLVEPFAANLKVINATRITWRCGIADEGASTTTPPTRCTGGVLGVRIIFPDCVAKDSNGQQLLDSADHKSHMARTVLASDGIRRCPNSHPIPVPTLTINANYNIPTTTGKVTLSSGAATTMHADFWNTWKQTTLQQLVQSCINAVAPSEPRPEECRAPTATA
jgi:Domain of unknown function (DUF1996)